MAESTTGEAKTRGRPAPSERAGAGPEASFLSVIVPTKGRPRYLEGCLTALARTEHPRGRFEVVVVNDGGGGEVEAVVGGFADSLNAHLVAPRRTGPSAARNAGAAAAAGRYLAFTDDDCEPAPGWLGALERALEGNPGAAVGGVTVNAVPADPRAAASQLVVDALHEHANRGAGGPRFFASSNIAFPVEGFRAIGGFDEGFRFAEDREICRRWIATGRRFAHASDAVVRHMRTLTLREFVGQHHGYGRGAWSFHRAATDGRGPRAGILGSIARRAMRPGPQGRRLETIAYVALSQAATASGFAREATSHRLGRRAAGGAERVAP